jgi:4-hydroxy-tetrahydrodipicolinate synthase
VQALGGRGIISASANALPEAFVALYRMMQAGNWPQAFALQKRLFPYVKACFSETNPAPLKYILHRKGKMENVLRLPLVPVSETTQALLDRAMARWESEGNRDL